MAAYIGYLLLAGLQIPLFRSKNNIENNHFNKKAYLRLCCLELIILAGVRGYTIGADTAVYLDALDYYNGLSLREVFTAELVWMFDFEWGYFTLTKLCAWAKMGKTVFLFVIAIIIYVPIFVSIKKYSAIPYISILCYFAFGMFSYSLGIFRQMIAISILLCGWNYIVERKFWRYAALVGVATLFHTTAVLAILLYALYGIKWERVIWFVLGLEFVLLLYGRNIIDLIIYLFPQYAGYIGSEFDLQGGSYAMLILLNIILFTSAHFSDKDNTQERMTICALTLAVLLQTIGYSMGIFGRVVPYFSIYTMFAIPNIVEKSNEKWKNLVTLTMVLILFALVYLQFNDNEYVTPYYTIFRNNQLEFLRKMVY
ncbi:MAG: EpsG family protein [Ruminococcaceae bacterium]|nr:EpsG family protein [Oscillospiraceae bacterium]